MEGYKRSAIIPPSNPLHLVFNPKKPSSPPPSPPQSARLDIGYGHKHHPAVMSAKGEEGGGGHSSCSAGAFVRLTSQRNRSKVVLALLRNISYTSDDDRGEGGGEGVEGSPNKGVDESKLIAEIKRAFNINPDYTIAIEKVVDSQGGILASAAVVDASSSSSSSSSSNSSSRPTSAPASVSWPPNTITISEITFSVMNCIELLIVPPLQLRPLQQQMHYFSIFVPLLSLTFNTFQREIYRAFDISSSSCVKMYRVASSGSASETEREEFSCSEEINELTDEKRWASSLLSSPPQTVSSLVSSSKPSDRDIDTSRYLVTLDERSYLIFAHFGGDYRSFTFNYSSSIDPQRAFEHIKASLLQAFNIALVGSSSHVDIYNIAWQDCSRRRRRIEGSFDIHSDIMNKANSTEETRTGDRSTEGPSDNQVPVPLRNSSEIGGRLNIGAKTSKRIVQLVSDYQNARFHGRSIFLDKTDLILSGEETGGEGKGDEVTVTCSGDPVGSLRGLGRHVFVKISHMKTIFLEGFGGSANSKGVTAGGSGRSAVVSQRILVRDSKFNNKNISSAVNFNSRGNSNCNSSNSNSSNSYDNDSNNSDVNISNTSQQLWRSCLLTIVNFFLEKPATAASVASSSSGHNRVQALNKSIDLSRSDGSFLSNSIVSSSPSASSSGVLGGALGGALGCGGGGDDAISNSNISSNGSSAASNRKDANIARRIAKAIGRRIKLPVDSDEDLYSDEINLKVAAQYIDSCSEDESFITRNPVLAREYIGNIEGAYTRLLEAETSAANSSLLLSSIAEASSSSSSSAAAEAAEATSTFYLIRRSYFVLCSILDQSICDSYDDLTDEGSYELVLITKILKTSSKIASSSSSSSSSNSSNIFSSSDVSFSNISISLEELSALLQRSNSSNKTNAIDDVKEEKVAEEEDEGIYIPSITSSAMNSIFNQIDSIGAGGDDTDSSSQITNDNSEILSIAKPDNDNNNSGSDHHHSKYFSDALSKNSSLDSPTPEKITPISSNSSKNSDNSNSCNSSSEKIVEVQEICNMCNLIKISVYTIPCRSIHKFCGDCLAIYVRALIKENELLPYPKLPMCPFACRASSNMIMQPTLPLQEPLAASTSAVSTVSSLPLISASPTSTARRSVNATTASNGKRPLQPRPPLSPPPPQAVPIPIQMSCSGELMVDYCDCLALDVNDFLHIIQLLESNNNIRAADRGGINLINDLYLVQKLREERSRGCNITLCPRCEVANYHSPTPTPLGNASSNSSSNYNFCEEINIGSTATNSAEVVVVVPCRQGHELKLALPATSMWYCSGRSILGRCRLGNGIFHVNSGDDPRANWKWRCDTCDFDLCQGCYDFKLQTSPNVWQLPGTSSVKFVKDIHRKAHEFCKLGPMGEDLKKRAASDAFVAGGGGGKGGDESTQPTSASSLHYPSATTTASFREVCEECDTTYCNNCGYFPFHHHCSCWDLTKLSRSTFSWLKDRQRLQALMKNYGGEDIRIKDLNAELAKLKVDLSQNEEIIQDVHAHLDANSLIQLSSLSSSSLSNLYYIYSPKPLINCVSEYLKTLPSLAKSDRQSSLATAVSIAPGISVSHRDNFISVEVEKRLAKFVFDYFCMRDAIAHLSVVKCPYCALCHVNVNNAKEIICSLATACYFNEEVFRKETALNFFMSAVSHKLTGDGDNDDGVDRGRSASASASASEVPSRRNTGCNKVFTVSQRKVVYPTTVTSSSSSSSGGPAINATLLGSGSTGCASSNPSPPTPTTPLSASFSGHSSLSPSHVEVSNRLAVSASSGLLGIVMDSGGGSIINNKREAEIYIGPDPYILTSEESSNIYKSLLADLDHFATTSSSFAAETAIDSSEFRDDLLTSLMYTRHILFEEEREIFHRACDVCSKLIEGPRVTCICCSDFNVCFVCSISTSCIEPFRIGVCKNSSKNYRNNSSNNNSSNSSDSSSNSNSSICGNSCASVAELGVTGLHILKAVFG